MAAREQPVEDRVGNGCAADPGMPVLDGQLTRHDRRSRAGPVVDHLHQVGASRAIRGGQPPVVQQQHVGKGKRYRGEPTAEAAVAVQHTQVLELPDLV
jgi:hypothetical protein